MKSLSKMLRGSCAIVTSGALVLSTFPAMAQDQPPPGAQLLPPGAAQQTPPGAAQPPPQPAAPQLGQAELEKLVAPIALYPDDLVAQILAASTYPIEVVQASRWVSAHPNVHDNALQDAMQQEQWDPSVKGLTAVPQVLAMMNDKLDWTQQLGEAFLAQPNDVSNAIQQLRAKAQSTGSLKSSQELKVTTVAADTPPPPPPAPPPPGVDPAMLPPPPPADYISIEPTDPDLYYVPIYDPSVVYGPWGWPDYEPFYWYPPGYVVGAAIIGFGVGFFVGSALWCHYNWGGGYGYGGGGWHGPVTINVVQYNQFNRTNIVAERNGTSNWQFDAAHRGTVQFQNATLRQQVGDPKNFQNLQGTHGTFQGTSQGNLQGTQQGTQQGTPGQLHGNLQGNVQGNVQGNTQQGNQSRGGTGPNARGTTNPSTIPNVNTNTRLNTNANVNTNTSINANVNRNLNINRNQNQNQNQNVNRNLNVNRNFNGGGGGGNFNRGGNFSRNAGPPPGLGGGGGGNFNGGGNFSRNAGPPPSLGGGGGGGGKGGKPDNHGHQ